MQMTRAPFSILILFIIVIFFAACRTREILIVSPVPGQITLPSHIKKIILVNNTGKNGNDCLLGLKQELDSTSNYNVSVSELSFFHPDEESMRFAGVDSNTAIILLQGCEPETENGGSYYKIYTWELYDLKTHSSIDKWKDKFTIGLVHNPDGSTTSTDWMEGQLYADRIAPRYIQTSRVYYVRGNKQMRKAARLAHDLHWDRAAIIWSQLSKDTTSRSCRKACFNLALANELSGKTEAALTWAERARALGERKAAFYISLLKQHKRALIQYQQQPLLKVK
jgi:hypothetical protein